MLIVVLQGSDSVVLKMVIIVALNITTQKSIIIIIAVRMLNLKYIFMMWPSFLFDYRHESSHCIFLYYIILYLLYYTAHPNLLDMAVHQNNFSSEHNTLNKTICDKPLCLCVSEWIMNSDSEGYFLF